MARKMPKQKPGKSEQVVGTPEVFLRSVKLFLGIKDFSIDLAALNSNTVCRRYISPKDDTFTQDWAWEIGKGKLLWGWLNPEFTDIAPYVRKAAEEMDRGAQVAMLIPASVGSLYWRDYVHGVADVRFPTGRTTFVGHTKPYPKDLALLLYSNRRTPGYHIWDWRGQI